MTKISNHRLITVKAFLQRWVLLLCCKYFINLRWAFVQQCKVCLAVLSISIICFMFLWFYQRRLFTIMCYFSFVYTEGVGYFTKYLITYQNSQRIFFRGGFCCCTFCIVKYFVNLDEGLRLFSSAKSVCQCLLVL